MVGQIRVKVTYAEKDYEERFTINPNGTLMWNSKPGKMTLAERKQFQYLLEALHKLMLDASMKKLEMEEE